MVHASADCAVGAAVRARNPILRISDTWESGCYLSVVRPVGQGCYWLLDENEAIRVVRSQSR